MDVTFDFSGSVDYEVTAVVNDAAEPDLSLRPLLAIIVMSAALWAGILLPFLA